MSQCASIRRLSRERRAAVALEFAITAAVFLTLVMGGIDAGLLWWTKNALEITAAMTARCAALGSCPDPGSYAVNMAQNWTVAGTISKSNLSFATQSQCYSSSGSYNKFYMVTISSPFWAGLPPPLSNITLQVSACYPIPS